MRIAQVYLCTAQFSLDRPFHYAIPEEFAGKIAKGVKVRVPFGAGNKPKDAIVTDILDESPFSELKEITSCEDALALVGDEQIELAEYMSKKYFCPFWVALKLMIPAGTDTIFEEWLTLTGKHATDEGKKALRSSAKQEALVRLLVENSGSVEFSVAKNSFGKGARSLVNTLVKKGIIDVSRREGRRVNDKFVRLAYYCGEREPLEVATEIESRSPSQAKVLEMLSGGDYSVPDIVDALGVTRNAVEALVKKGLVDFRSCEILRNPVKGKDFTRTEPEKPTEEQKTAIDAVCTAKDGVFLLHGVTSSGKTEVYMQIIHEVLSRGKQAIVLVPEIALTPQMTNRFYSRFGDVVAVLHSALSLGERLDEWKRIRRGDARVVVGARSAVFAPCGNIGVIIVDEEHESSYKSETMPRYHARDIAAWRCERAHCQLLIASATPSIESYYKAKIGEYTLLEMKKRYNDNPLPEVEIVDLRKELEEGNKYVISRRLAREMQKNIGRGEQTVLFLNRRGYSTFVSCRSCGYVFTCPNCSVSLTYHAVNDSLTCHLCGFRTSMRRVCPACGSGKVKDFGRGTQKAEQQIKQIFTTARVLRMDVDTTSGKHGHEKILEKFASGDYDILLGTQMVTKGLDFPHVTLVGVLAADSALFMDDFRAQERTFDLITQVCGRAGRGDAPGRAIVQTYMPENETLLYAKEQDYKGFYETEIKYRETFSYPPFRDIINIIVSSPDHNAGSNAAISLAQELRIGCAAAGIENYEIFGASAAPIAKLSGRYRFRIWMKCADSAAVSDIIRACKIIASTPRDVSVSIDINPYSMN